MTEHSYSKLVDEAIEALPIVVIDRPRHGGVVTTSPVLDKEPALLILAVLDQAQLPDFTARYSPEVIAKIAGLLGVKPLTPKV